MQWALKPKKDLSQNGLQFCVSLAHMNQLEPSKSQAKLAIQPDINAFVFTFQSDIFSPLFGILIAQKQYAFKE